MRGSSPTVGSSRNSTCGIRDQRPGDLEPAALTAAVGVDGPVDELAEAERVDDVGDAPGRGGRVEPPQPGVHGEVAATGEGSVDDRFLEHDRAHPARLDRLRGDVEAGQAGVAGRGGDGGGEHADGGRLAGTVGAEQTEHLAGGDVEVDALHRLDATGIGLGELADLDG